MRGGGGDDRRHRQKKQSLEGGERHTRPLCSPSDQGIGEIASSGPSLPSERGRRGGVFKAGRFDIIKRERVSL